MVNGWPQKRSNELNIALAQFRRHWNRKMSPSVMTEILILLVCTFFFQKQSSSNAKFKLVSKHFEMIKKLDNGWIGKGESRVLKQ
jgi:hypothetical protein